VRKCDAMAQGLECTCRSRHFQQAAAAAAYRRLETLPPCAKYETNITAGSMGGTLVFNCSEMFAPRSSRSRRARPHEGKWFIVTLLNRGCGSNVVLKHGFICCFVQPRGLQKGKPLRLRCCATERPVAPNN
jgi:hypothetical protein